MSNEIIVEYIFLTLGSIVATILFYDPFRNIINKKDISLEKINNIPFLFMLLQCIMWIAYACFAKNFSIIPVNFIGFIFSLYCNLFFYRLTIIIREDIISFSWSTRFHMHLFVFMISVSFFCSLLIFFLVQNENEKQFIFGFLCNTCTILFFASPLTTIWNVIRSMDSTSISFSLSLMITLNGSFWVIYGIYKMDLFIIIPNMMGSILGIIQLVIIFICWIYKKNKGKEKISYMQMDNSVVIPTSELD